MCCSLAKILIWESTTKTSEVRRGPKLLGKLEGTAFEKMEYLNPFTLKVKNGVELFKRHIQKRSELLENRRVGKIMDSFLFDFSRNLFHAQARKPSLSLCICSLIQSIVGC